LGDARLREAFRFFSLMLGRDMSWLLIRESRDTGTRDGDPLGSDVTGGGFNFSTFGILATEGTETGSE